MSLTPDELEILKLLAVTWNKLAELPQQHPEDLDEARQDIHRLQDRVAARPAYRELAERLSGRDEPRAK